MPKTDTIDALKDTRFFRESDFAEDFYAKIVDLHHWRLLAERFDIHLRQEAGPSDPIPKRIHQIWIGGSLPRSYQVWTESWRKLNPGWEYRLWDKEAILDFGLVNEEAFRKSVSNGVKSDIARYEILSRLGGIYADTDFECLQPLADVARRCSFFAGTVFHESPVIANGIMGSAPGHPLLTKLIENITGPVTTRDGMGILHKTGPFYLTRQFFENVSLLGSSDVVFPSTYFYPLPNYAARDEIAENNTKRYARSWSIAIHHWETSWLRAGALRVFLNRLKNRIGL